MNAADWTDGDGDEVTYRDLSPRERSLVAALAAVTRERDGFREDAAEYERRWREATEADPFDDLVPVAWLIRWGDGSVSASEDQAFSRGVGGGGTTHPLYEDPNSDHALRAKEADRDR